MQSLWERISTDNAEIIAVGTELLLGQIENTNATFLAKALSDLGINCLYRSVVGDNPERLAQAIERAGQRSDLVFLTGGLGPTQDDITMEVLSKVVGQDMVYHEEEFRIIENYFKSQGRMTAPENKKQAYFPALSKIIPNPNGTAPGAMVPWDKADKPMLFVVLPGPPNENRPMFEMTVKPFLEPLAPFKFHHTYVRLVGIGESDLIHHIPDLLSEEQKNPTVAPYASLGEVSLRVTYKCKQDEEDHESSKIIEILQERLGQYIYEIGDRDLVHVLGETLIHKKQSITTVESMTAGLLSATLAQVDGISEVLRGGLVTYQVRVKEDQLGIDPELIREYGAISPQCAEAMALKGRNYFLSDYCLSITGNAGPQGQEDKPVGLTYIACAGPKGVKVVEKKLKGDREKNRLLAVKQALALLRNYMMDIGD